MAEPLGEYHRFLYLHTKLQLNAFNEKIRFDVRELISMKTQGRMYQKAKRRNTVSRLIKLSRMRFDVVPKESRLCLHGFWAGWAEL